MIREAARAFARQIPAIDSLVQQRDALLRRVAELEAKMEAPPSVADSLYEQMKEWLLLLPRGSRVLELGTLRSIPDRATIRPDLAPQAEWLGSDFQAGADVDIVADAHSLTAVTGREAFDAIMACSVFEHLARPWIAAKEIADALKPGGRVFVQTHFAFPIHGYPSDYFRFTREALALLFADAGLTSIETSYAFAAKIMSKEIGDNGQVFLNSNVMAQKSQ
jgi:hypothetical protein